MGATLVKQQVSKAVLITGCSSGIGKATALRLAQGREKHGWTVWATARKKDSLRELEAAGCHTVALDVTDEASMARAVQAIETVHGAVGILINNAGYAQSGPIEAVPMDLVRKQFETNVFGLVRLTQLVLPKMRAQRWGRIINVSSVGGRLVFPGGGFYHATKYAVEALSDALRFEVRGFGIRVVLIEPGIIRSGFGEVAVGNLNLEGEREAAYGAFHGAVTKATKELYENGPMARMAGEAGDVGETIERAILSSRPRARYTVTGIAKVMLAQRALMNDSVWDAFLRMSFPSPGEQAG
jgi:NAD(P)-dependent dehydrogenase (short-subunit alcohol dehydrogenase family)